MNDIILDNDRDYQLKGSPHAHSGYHLWLMRHKSYVIICNYLFSCG